MNAADGVRIWPVSKGIVRTEPQNRKHRKEAELKGRTRGERIDHAEIKQETGGIGNELRLNQLASCGSNN